MARLDARMEIRLDSETLGRLEVTAKQRGVSVAALAREAIGRLLEEGGMRREVTDLEEALALETPVPIEPQELARELEKRYECHSGASPS